MKRAGGPRARPPRKCPSTRQSAWRRASGPSDPGRFHRGGRNDPTRARPIGRGTDVAKVIEFPSRKLRGLAFLERRIRELLAKRGADEELMEFAAATVRKIYERNAEAENYSFRLSLPDGLGEEETARLRRELETGIEQVRSENHAIIVRLIAELALAEVKIFQHERDN